MALSSKILFSNRATTTLAAPMSANSPSAQVLAGAGALFPVLGPGQAFIATLEKNGSPNICEAILVNGHASGSDNFTGLLRGQEGTTALAWNAGDSISLYPTGFGLDQLLQAVDAQSQTFNYAQDIGSANAYKALLTPAINARLDGLAPIYFFVQHPNTGPCTLTDNIGTVPLVTADGEALRQNDLQQYSIAAAFFDGAAYRLLGVHHLTFPQMNGSIGSSQVPFSAVAQWEANLAINFSQMLGQLLSYQVPNNIFLPGVPTTTTPGTNESSTRIATTAFVNPASLLASPGYFKTASGHLVAMGICNPNGGSVVVTFPVTFTTVVHIATGSIAGGPVQTWLGTGTVSGSGCTIHNSGGQSYYIAAGF